MNEHRALLRPPLSVVLSINGQFLVAACAGFVAWLSWPVSLRWWPFAIISAALGFVAVRSLIQALGLIFQIYNRECEIAAMLSQGRTQHPAHLATADTLRRAKMTDD